MLVEILQALSYLDWRLILEETIAIVAGLFIYDWLVDEGFDRIVKHIKKRKVLTRQDIS